jgi:hypothetical protein
LGRKDYDQDVRLAVEREGEELSLEGHFPPFKPAPIYRRDKPTARVSVRVQEGVVRIASRNVRRLKLLLAPEMFGEAVKVEVNGKEVAAKPVAIPLETLLQRYGAEADSGRLFTREMVIELPAR